MAATNFCSAPTGDIYGWSASIYLDRYVYIHKKQLFYRSLVFVNGIDVNYLSTKQRGITVLPRYQTRVLTVLPRYQVGVLTILPRYQTGVLTILPCYQALLYYWALRFITEGLIQLRIKVANDISHCPLIHSLLHSVL